jgi:hypothetical protein
MEDYDYDRYQLVLGNLLESMWRDPDNLVVGENISDIPEVKIIFDGYADLETGEGDNYEYVEGGDINQESYAIFIHKDTLTENFEFPEHDMTPWCLVHRPKEEVCIYAWYTVDQDEWNINSLEETSDHEMENSQVMQILEGIQNKYFNWE